MLAEHLVYSTAIAIVAGMIFFRYTGRDCSWIIVIVAYLPDMDKIAGPILRHFFGITVIFGYTIHRGVFHTVAAMFLFALIIAVLLHPFGVRYFDAFIFTAIGTGAHLLEDALVYPAGYMYLWPLSRDKAGLAWLSTGLNEENYTATFFHIANTEVLLIGLALLVAAVLIRTRVEGPGWIRWYMPDSVYRKFFLSECGVTRKTP